MKKEITNEEKTLEEFMEENGITIEQNPFEDEEHEEVIKYEIK